MIWEVRWKGSLFSKFMATAFSFWLYKKRKDLIILIRISGLYRISFTYNPTASFFRHKIVEWPWIQFKMRPMLFKKSCNLFYAYVFLRSVKLACWLLVCYVRFQQKWGTHLHPVVDQNLLYFNFWSCRLIWYIT